MLKLKLLLFVSGAGALLLEVAWFRRMAQVTGATSVALAAVLAAVLGGMAIGSAWIGRLLPRATNPLRLYATLEAGVALSALLSPWMLDGSRGLYAALFRMLHGAPFLLGAAQLLLSFLLLAPPSLFLGASLPAATAALRDPKRDAGRLYAANTFGAVAGTLLAGFVLLEAVGLSATMRLAALLPAFASAGAFALAKGGSGAFSGAAPAGAGEMEARRAIFLYAVSGFLGLAAEVCFARGLVLVFGSSTYAFSAMLAVFLAGIAAGSALGSRLRRVPIEALVAATAVLFSAGAFAIVLLPRLWLQLYAWSGGGLAAGHASRFALAALVQFPGCLGLGAAFTLAARSADVGRLYAFNTIASVAGSTLAVFALIPWLGPQHALVVTAMAVAALLAAWTRRRSLWAAVVLCGSGLLPPGEAAEARLYGGIYHTPEGYLRDGAILEEAWEDGADVPRVIFGREMTVSLHRWYGPVSLLVDGKTEASEQSISDAQHLALLGHVPMAVHPSPRRVLVVGLGLGKTWQAVEQHRPEAVTVAEIEPAVVEAAASLGVKPRRVVHADARTWLLATDETYDVITSDPIHPWVRGSGDLYTSEYFEACRARLAPGGVACQWLPLYQMGVADLRAVIRTFASVFRSAAWFSGSDLILVGVRSGEVAAPRALSGAAMDALRAIGAEDLAGLRVAGHEALLAAAGAGPLLTEDGLRLEFSTPRQMGNPEMADCLDFVERLWGTPATPYGALLRAQAAWARGDGRAWMREVERAEREAPGNGFVRLYVADMALQIAAETGPDAERWLRRAKALLPGDPRCTGVEADLRASRGDRSGAAALYRALLERQPDSAYLRRRLARVE